MKTIFDFRAFLNFLGRNKLYTAINIFGFSVSLMFVILLITYTRQEYAVDQFHSNKERIFRLCNESGSCFAPLIGRDLKDRYPEIDTYVRIHSSNEIITGEGHHLKARYLLADPDFFKVFSFTLAQGDTKVFHKLYEHFFVALCIFARSFSLKPEEAEDIVQEVFCRMYDEHRLFEGLNTLKSYLYTAVRNRSFNYLRDEKRRSIREAQFLNNLKAEEEGYNSALENEIYRQLKLLLEELPEQCKNIFQRTLSGDTSEKIAADLKLSVETVKTQRKKAKRILRERYTLLFKTFGILF